MIAPVYKHDCDACRFLGHVEGCDLYVCGGERPMSLSVVARYGSFGPDYASMPVDVVRAGMSLAAGASLRALRRAVELAGAQS